MIRYLPGALASSLALMGCLDTSTQGTSDSFAPDARVDSIMVGEAGGTDPGITPRPDVGSWVDGGGFVDIAWPDYGPAPDTWGPDTWVWDVAIPDYGPTPDVWMWDNGPQPDVWTWDYGPLPDAGGWEAWPYDTWTYDTWTWDYGPQPDAGSWDGWTWDYGSWPDSGGWDAWSWDYGPLPDGGSWDGLTWDGWTWDYGPVPDSWSWDGQTWDFGPMPDVPGVCGAVSEIGCCDGDISRWCAGGMLFTDNCADYGQLCGWVDGPDYYGCDGNGTAPSNDPPIECP